MRITLLGLAVLFSVLPSGRLYSLLGNGQCVNMNGGAPRTSNGVPTVAACAGLCERFACSAFEFWYAAEECGLFVGGNGTPGGGFAAPAGGVHAGCFSSEPFPTPPPTTYLVQESDELFAPAYNGPCQSKVASRAPRYVTLKNDEPQSVCAAVCVADRRCTGYSYAPTQTRCKLHYLPLSRYPGPANTDGVACHVKQPGSLSSAGVEANELRWVRRTPIPLALSSSVSAVVGNVFVVFGRAGTQCVGLRYSLSTLAWTSLPSPPRCDSGQSITAGPGGAIYLIGGRTARAAGGSAGAVQKFSTLSNTWQSELEQTLFATGAAAVGGTSDGWVVVCGGVVGGSVTELCAEYDPLTFSWEWTSSMPMAVHSAAYGMSGGTLYVAGGYLGTDSARVPTDEIQVYTKATRTWSVSFARLPTPVGGLGAMAFYGSSLFVVGGETGNGPQFDASATTAGTFTSVTRVNVVTWRVTRENPLLEATHDASVSVDSDGRLYVAGGADRQGKSCSDVFQVAHRTVAMGISFFQYVESRSFWLTTGCLHSSCTERFFALSLSLLHQPRTPAQPI
jgi:hypothetical protein